MNENTEIRKNKNELLHILVFRNFVFSEKVRAYLSVEQGSK